MLVMTGSVYPSRASAAEPPRHWSFEPVRRPPIPEVRQRSWPRTEVDRFILARLESRGLQPTQPASKRALIRRATFDLIGLPPTPEEIEAFLADQSPGAFGRVVDRLLDSPHYGERWGRHWLDVVRYADTAGETADYPLPDAWRYRNYVIDAFNADKPYDEFIREQVAGDILAREGSPALYAERVTATGFLALSRRFGFDSENYHHLTIQDTIDTMGKAVLGLSLGCARCHDHKFDPIPVEDYYALYGIFDSTRYAFPGSEQKQRVRVMNILAPPDHRPARWDAFDERVGALQAKLARNQISAPGLVLRSIDDWDGDFELQAAAAGGSRGVLVPPWTYQGPVSVSHAAQSPFRNAYPGGKAGANLPAGTNSVRIAQALRSTGVSGRNGVMHFNLDFRVTTPEPDSVADGSFRIWLGPEPSALALTPEPVIQIFVSAGSIHLGVASNGNSNGNFLSRELIRSLTPGRWQNLQLDVHLADGAIAGRCGSPGEVVAFFRQGSGPIRPGSIDFIAVDTDRDSAKPRPRLEIDNIAFREAPIGAVDTNAAESGPVDEDEPAAVMKKLRDAAGLDGDFELQEPQTAPSTPWEPGPNARATVSAESQSPYRQVYPDGRLGLRLPAGGGYDGFMQTLSAAWRAGDAESLRVGFDFRCSGGEPAGGSWRYYLGHGPGGSGAIELFLNGGTFFIRNGEVIERVADLKTGEWYTVGMIVNLGDRKYTGSIGTPDRTTSFAGSFKVGWDGVIDCTFVDSYGHINGPRPALDFDNFAIDDSSRSASKHNDTADPETRRRRVADLRKRLTEARARIESARAELAALLRDGPCGLAYGVAEGTPVNARIHRRGDPEQLDREVTRGFIEALGGGPLPSDTRGSGRKELADWLTAPGNPLTARVMVNRIWAYHFGVGLVKTPNDFGTRGVLPTHPDLLDYLATEFIRRGWSIKEMHRLIMLGATYQQGSDPAGTDSSDDDFARFTRRRLEAEAVRDAILAVSGDLDRSIGRGHPFPPPETWSFTQHGPFSAVYDHNRRSVYLMIQRIKRHPFVALFDGADPNDSTPARRATTVPTQALFFLNNPFLHEQSERFAERLSHAQTGDAPRIDLAFRLAFGRPPTPEECREAMELLAAYRAELSGAEIEDPENPDLLALAALARVLFGSNEFVYLD